MGRIALLMFLTVTLAACEEAASPTDLTSSINQQIESPLQNTVDSNYYPPRPISLTRPLVVFDSARRDNVVEQAGSAERLRPLGNSVSPTTVEARTLNLPPLYDDRSNQVPR
jgi:hypothetical protein